ncbi:MAG: prolipoprotein diacylglyceryl transferase [Clostridia bacterium]|nr:prolipoprotein diacylglyceryl transferase [Clostridia bacterium]
MHPITFPNLGLELDINPVAFNVLGRDIYWYGIIIVFGIVLALILAWKNRDTYGISWDTLTDFAFIAIPVGIICARFYYVVFEWDYYKNNLSEIIKIWNGGIAIYGAIIGGIITAIIFCKKRKIKFLDLCDFCAPYLALCQSIGRWGNFANREAYGEVTDSFLKMGIFNDVIGEYIYVQPTFLYESICTFIIFCILYSYRHNKKFSGEIFYLYMTLYGIARFVVEGYRSDSLYLFGFRVSQVLALIFTVVFGVMLLKTHWKTKKANKD